GIAFVATATAYVLAVLGFSIGAGRKAGPPTVAALALVFPVVHFSYGVGFLRCVAELALGSRHKTWQAGVPGLVAGPERELRHAPEEPDSIAEVDDREDERERRHGGRARLASGADREPQHGEHVGRGRGYERDAERVHPGTEDSGGSQGEQEGGWDELPERHHPAQLPHHERLGVAVLVVHPRHLPHRLAGVVPGHHVGHEQDPPAVSDEAGVEFAVLIALPLVEQSDTLERLSATTEKRNRIDPALLPDPDAEVGVADPERLRQRDRDRPPDGRLASGRRDQHAADVIGAGGL